MGPARLGLTVPICPSQDVCRDRTHSSTSDDSLRLQSPSALDKDPSESKLSSSPPESNSRSGSKRKGKNFTLFASNPEKPAKPKEKKDKKKKKGKGQHSQPEGTDSELPPHAVRGRLWLLLIEPRKIH